MNRIARGLLRLARLQGAARGAVIALGLALVLAAPAAGAQPVKTAHLGLYPFTIPADTACPFAVEGQPDFGFSQYWTVSDTPLRGTVHAHGAYVNADTGARYPTLDNFSFAQTYDPATGSIYVKFQGQGAWWFLPGDTGPFGTVGPHGAFYDFVGMISATIYADGATTQFSWKGTATDICAALS